MKDTDNPEIEAYIKKGFMYFSKGQFQEACDSFTKSIDMGADRPDAYCFRGLAQAKLGEFFRAIKDFNKALEKDPNFAEAYMGRGHAFYSKKDYDKSIADYNKAFQILPADKSKKIFIYRADAHYEKKDWKMAVHDYEQVIRDSPKMLKKIDTKLARAYINYGQELSQKEDYQDTVEYLSKGLNIAGDNVKGQFLLGDAYICIGEIDKAREVMKKIQTMVPADNKYHILAGEALKLMTEVLGV